MRKFIYEYAWIIWLTATMSFGANVHIGNKWYWIGIIPTIFLVELKIFSRKQNK